MLFREVSVKTAASFLMAGVMMIAGPFSWSVITLMLRTFVTHKTTI
jgi:hypothetical protein